MSEQYWTLEYLKQISNDGEADIARRLAPIYSRYSLSVTSGTAEYDLEDQTREIQSITWKGFKVHPLINQEEAIRINAQYRTIETTRPDWYMIGSGGMKKILFIPVPGETISKDDSVLFSRTGISSRVIISYRRLPERDTDVYSIPDYMARRTIKSYVLARAYAQEGKGQNLKASQYYEKKYEQGIAMHRIVQSKYSSRHIYAIGQDRETFSRSQTRRLASLPAGWTITPP